MFYKFFIKQFLFFLNPEFAHNLVIRLLKILFVFPFFPDIIKRFYCVEDVRLERNVFGLSFKNPVGLAAGFDKNANIFNEFSALGFGFIEIGTVTPLPQSGNKKPRLFRLKNDQALINRMGFNNDGIDAIVKRLKEKNTNIILGGNIGRNKVTSNDMAANDYLICLEKIAPYVDYLVLNISSPNTPNLVELQKQSSLSILLEKVQAVNLKKYNKPILIKISPDLSFKQIDEVLVLIKKFHISGIIATNTSSKRLNLVTNQELIEKKGPGGLSGKPIHSRAKEIVSYIFQKTSGNLPIIAVGGIMNANHAIDMLNAGASLVQIYTGFVYNGPSIVKDINSKILELESE